MKTYVIKKQITKIHTFDVEGSSDAYFRTGRKSPKYSIAGVCFKVTELKRWWDSRQNGREGKSLHQNNGKPNRQGGIA